MIQGVSLDKVFYDKKILDSVNMEVPPGSIYGLIGCNGSGKTTLLRIISGIYLPSAGSIKIMGENPYENTELKMKIFHVPENISSFHSYTILRMARFYAGLYKFWNWDTYNKILQDLGINEKMRISRLSQGQKQQASMLYAISSGASLILMDECMTCIDAYESKKLWKHIMEEIADRNLTVVLSGSDLKEMEEYCDRVGFISDGKIKLQNGLDDLCENISKIQIAFASGALPEDLCKRIDILPIESQGSIHTYITVEKSDDLKAKLQEYSPLFVDIMPITLEEIFLFCKKGESYGWLSEKLG